MDKFLSKYQCGFRKGYNAHCLLAMNEKWKKAVDNGNVFGALLPCIWWTSPKHLTVFHMI